MNKLLFISVSILLILSLSTADEEAALVQAEAEAETETVPEEKCECPSCPACECEQCKQCEECEKCQACEKCAECVCPECAKCEVCPECPQCPACPAPEPCECKECPAQLSLIQSELETKKDELQGLLSVQQELDAEKVKVQNLQHDLQNRNQEASAEKDTLNAEIAELKQKVEGFEKTNIGLVNAFDVLKNELAATQEKTRENQEKTRTFGFACTTIKDIMIESIVFYSKIIMNYLTKLWDIIISWPMWTHVSVFLNETVPTYAGELWAKLMEIEHFKLAVEWIEPHFAKIKEIFAKYDGQIIELVDSNIPLPQNDHLTLTAADLVHIVFSIPIVLVFFVILRSCFSCCFRSKSKSKSGKSTITRHKGSEAGRVSPISIAGDGKKHAGKQHKKMK